ncbi:hypothetical protein ABFT23_06255 [Nocardioides sp. C4-1]|uniref:hypothetical protein n=1 Tax=Nocardioides sp. C4-1 TaxID=3151851 RepID=UPI003263E191
MRLAVASVSVLVLLPLAACSDDEPDDARTGGGAGGGHLADALAVVPATSETVQVVDRSAVAERLGITDAEPDDYSSAIGGDAVGGTELASYLRVMSDGGAAFDERDVVWGVSGTAPGGLPFSAYRLDADVDLDQVGDDLAETGRTEDEVAGRRHLSGLPTEGTGGYPPTFLDVYLDPDRDLLVTGPGGPEVLSTVDGDQDSLAGSGTVETLLGDTDDVELAILGIPARCTGVGGAIGRQLTPDQARALAEQVDELVAPVATAYLATAEADGDGVEELVRLQHADDDAAEADLEARRAYLDEGVMIGTGAPFSDIGSVELERDGSVLQGVLELERAGGGRLLALNGDGPFVC